MKKHIQNQFMRSNEDLTLEDILNYSKTSSPVKMLEKSPKNLPDLIKQIAAGNIDLHELKRMQSRQKDLESDMDRLKVLEGESEAFSFFKTQEDEDEKAKKKKLYRYNTNIKESVGGLSDTQSVTQSTNLTSGSNSTGPSKSNSTGPSLTTPLNILETQPSITIETPLVQITAPETVPPSPAVPIKVMPKPISPSPSPRDIGSTPAAEPAPHGPDQASSDTTISIPEIAVTTIGGDEEEATIVTENKC